MKVNHKDTFLVAWVWGWTLLAHCGGEPGELFDRAATTRVVADGGVPGEGGSSGAATDEDALGTAGEAGGATLQGGAAGSAGADLDAGAGGSGGTAEPQPEAGAWAADATCWPPGEGCPCPCYRNAGMDAHCPSYERRHAWVCHECAPTGCRFEYDAQATLACCP